MRLFSTSTLALACTTLACSPPEPRFVEHAPEAGEAYFGTVRQLTFAYEAADGAEPYAEDPSGV